MKKQDAMKVRISIMPGEYVRANIEKLSWNYLPSKRNCKHYSNKEDSYSKCMVKKTVDCLKLNISDTGCIHNRCMERFKTHFEMNPITSNPPCNTTTADKKGWKRQCLNPMKRCQRQLKSTDQCPIPCKKLSFNWQKGDIGKPYKPMPSNQMKIQISYATLDVEINEEVLIQEWSSFIGTVGGSLGLFIGFSYTGFVGQVIDYFIRN